MIFSKNRYRKCKIKILGDVFKLSNGLQNSIDKAIQKEQKIIQELVFNAAF